MALGLCAGLWYAGGSDVCSLGDGRGGFESCGLSGLAVIVPVERCGQHKLSLWTVTYFVFSACLPLKEILEV